MTAWGRVKNAAWDAKGIQLGTVARCTIFLSMNKDLFYYLVKILLNVCTTLRAEKKIVLNKWK